MFMHVPPLLEMSIADSLRKTKTHGSSSPCSNDENDQTAILKPTTLSATPRSTRSGVTLTRCDCG